MSKWINLSNIMLNLKRTSCRVLSLLYFKTGKSVLCVCSWAHDGHRLKPANCGRESSKATVGGYLWRTGWEVGPSKFIKELWLFHSSSLFSNKKEDLWIAKEKNLKTPKHLWENNMNNSQRRKYTQKKIYSLLSY